MKRILILAAALAGCDTVHKSPTANQVSSLALELLDPAPGALGTPTSPVSAQQATFNLRALDDQGALWPAQVDVQVFVSFGGVKTGMLTSCGASATDPISIIHLTDGVAMNQTVMLPAAFGPTSIWLDDPVSHATGASPTIYFHDPLITDVQTPTDLTAANATFCSPFNGKYINVTHATGSGQLVVSSVFGDAFAVTDTGATAFNSMYIYSFGQPPDDIVTGRIINSLSGNVSKFVGFTELNFPLFDAADDQPLGTVPQPVVVSQSSIANQDNIGLLKYDASVVQLTGTICDPNPPNPTNDSDIQGIIDQWEKFDTFILDGDGTCDSFNNFAIELPAKVLGSFDPLQAKTKTATVVGMLHNSSGQNPALDANGRTIPCTDSGQCITGTCVDSICKKGAFNFWTIQPRTQADIVVQ
jgi:hypothetical protein